MKNKYLILLVSILIFGSTLISCVKDIDDEDKAIVFLGSESYFKFFDEVIPDTLANIFINYTDSVKKSPSDSVYYSEYLDLYNVFPIATNLGGYYKVEQDPFIEFPDPFEDRFKKERSTFHAKLRLSGQNNCVISMDMIFDTLVETESSPEVQYKMYESVIADTMYVVGERGNTGLFLMYGTADNEVYRGYMMNGEYLKNYYQEYKYTSKVILVGRKTEKGISDIQYFEYICDDFGSVYYPVGCIRAFGDIDDFSNSISVN